MRVCTFKEYQVSPFMVWDLLFMIVFKIDIVLNCVTEKYIRDAERDVYEQNIGMIILIYLKDEFLFDLITSFPYYQIFGGKFRRSHLLYLVKVLRLRAGLLIIGSSHFIEKLREYSKKRALKLQSKIKKQEEAMKITTYVAELVYAF